MILIWQGLGFLAILIPFLLSLLAQAAVDSMYGANYYSTHHVFAFVALIVSSIIVWFVGAHLNNKQQGRVMIDKATGQEVVFKRRHTLFWIPMQWFSPVVAAFALLMLTK